MMQDMGETNRFGGGDWAVMCKANAGKYEAWTFPQHRLLRGCRNTLRVPAIDGAPSNVCVEHLNRAAPKADPKESNMEKVGDTAQSNSEAE